MIRFAVIGQGHIGKRHAEMIRSNSACELVAVCDILPKETLGLNGLKEKFYSSVDEMLKNHPEVEVVNVCSPILLHAEHTIQTLTAGKHVVIEKPMALKKEDCEMMLQKAMQAHKQVFRVMQNRYSPPSASLN